MRSSFVFLCTLVLLFQICVCDDDSSQEDGSDETLKDLKKNVSSLWSFVKGMRQNMNHDLHQLHQHQNEIAGKLKSMLGIDLEHADSHMHHMDDGEHQHLQSSDHDHRDEHHDNHSHEHHGDHHDEHHDEHHYHHGDGHHEEHHGEHHDHHGDGHHEEHHGDHHGEHRDHHGDGHHEEHHGDGHHDEHHGGHHEHHDHVGHRYGDDQDHRGHEHDHNESQSEHHQQEHAGHGDEHHATDHASNETHREESHHHHHHQESHHRSQEHVHHHSYHHHHGSHLSPAKYDFAVCTVEPNRAIPEEQQQNVTGKISLWQKKNGTTLHLHINLKGFKVPVHGDPQAGEHSHSGHSHGFHVHQEGDLSNGCQSTGPHFNPTGVLHGGPNSTVRHVGDLGNIECNEHGVTNVIRTDNFASLHGEHSIIGKSLVVHERTDDLGTNPDNPASLSSGDAGTRIACCLIQRVERLSVEHARNYSHGHHHHH